jgi:hypothetical protein
MRPRSAGIQGVLGFLNDLADSEPQVWVTTHRQHRRNKRSWRRSASMNTGCVSAVDYRIRCREGDNRIYLGFVI